MENSNDFHRAIDAVASSSPQAVPEIHTNTGLGPCSLLLLAAAFRHHSVFRMKDIFIVGYKY